MEIDIMKNKKDKMARQSKLQRVTWQIGEAVLRRGKLALPVL